jgi:hypothetical protein
MSLRRKGGAREGQKEGRVEGRVEEEKEERRRTARVNFEEYQRTIPSILKCDKREESSIDSAFLIQCTS